jgi:rod shape determining protein RodA
MLKFDRRLIQNFDWVLLGIVVLIGIMCIANLYSAVYSVQSYGTPVYIKQLYFFIMGFGLILAIVSFDYRFLVEMNYTLYAGIIGLLVFSLFSGQSHADTQRWINLGFFRLQPSEPAKLMLVITLASYYYRKDTGKGFTLKELIVPIILMGIPFLLILKQPDLGTALMLSFVFVSMTLFVKLRFTTLASLVSFALVIIGLGWKFFLKPYQKKRIETFLNPDADALNSGYHITQSKIAVGSGGPFGKGYLHGTQGQLDFLPERHTDFAFSIWAEEWGFLGSLIFLAIYFSLIFWGLNIAASSRDKFGTLLCVGVVSLIFWQAFINLAMIMGLLPVVGMPLPLFSYGGSSLLTTMAGIGILLNVRMRRYQAPV